MAMSNGLRSCASKLMNSSKPILSNPASRKFHSSGMKMMGGHGHDEPFYLHAKHMYNLDRMKHQKVIMPLAVLCAFSIGVGVPIYAVVFQQKKTASG
ncbi:hypothetical protein KSS87_009074 [Heliosperma pusillum]|nr:hypothetical protein KSS87_009074 [Heliosperma pusillum]